MTQNETNTTGETFIQDLTVGNVPKQLITFSFPLVLSGLLQAAYNMVDMVVVGRYLGSSGLSAVSIGGDVLMVLTFIAMGFSNAAQVIISQYIGAGQNERVSRIIGTLFTFLGACALTMTVVCLILRNNILHWINTPAESWDYTMSYVITCLVGLIFIYGYNLVSAILRGMGDSRHPFLFIAIASIINISLDFLFIAVLKLEVFGAALATVIGQAISFLCSLSILYRKQESFLFDFHLKHFRIHGDVLRPLISLGIPMSIQYAAVSISRIYVNSWINSYGVVASAVSGMGHKLETVNNSIVHGFTTAGSSMVAQCIGARKYERVTKIMLTSLLVCSVLGLFFCLITIFRPRAVFSIFTSDPTALDMAITYVPIAVISFVCSSLRPAMFALINGSGKSTFNLLVALMDGIVARIGLALLLGIIFQMGVYGFWYGNALAGLIPFLIGIIFYFSGRWKNSDNPII